MCCREESCEALLLDCQRRAPVSRLVGLGLPFLAFLARFAPFYSHSFSLRSFSSISLQPVWLTVCRAPKHLHFFWRLEPETLL